MWDQDGKLVNSQQVSGKATKRMGCYKMRYLVKSEDKEILIAVGVIDILPHGL